MMQTILLLLIILSIAFSQPLTIKVDGLSTDWPGTISCTVGNSGCLVLVNDPARDAGERYRPETDILRILGANNRTHAFLRIDVSRIPPVFISGQIIRVCIDLPQERTPGFAGTQGIPGCNGVGTDVMYRLSRRSTGALDIKYYDCSTENCLASGEPRTPQTTPPTLAINRVFEIGIPLASMRLLGTLGETVRAAVFYNNNDIDMDDRVPNVGTFAWNILPVQNTISGIVWLDQNANGIRSSETGINNIPVSLYKDGVKIADTTTNILGVYTFTGINIGLGYKVVVNTAGYFISPKDQGTDPLLNSDINPNGETDVFQLPEDVEVRYDAGLYLPSSITIFTWVDRNDNGAQDIGEIVKDSVTVKLLKDDVQVGSSQVTNLTGVFYWGNLAPGNYKIDTDIPSATWKYSLPYQGADNKDSDVSTSTGITHSVTLVSGQNHNSLAAGLVPLHTINGIVFNDENVNGVMEGEPVIPSVTVDLLSTTQPTKQSDTSGTFTYDNIVPGTYQIRATSPSNAWEFTIYSPNPQGNFVNSISGTLGTTVNIVLGDVPTTVTIYIGLYKMNIISGYFWHDVNADGIVDNPADEPLIPSASVRLYKSGVQVRLTTTDGDGHFEFDRLSPGNYYVQILRPTAFQYFDYSPSQRGPDRDRDSDVNYLGNTFDVLVLGSDTTYTLGGGVYQSALCVSVTALWDAIEDNVAKRSTGNFMKRDEVATWIEISRYIDRLPTTENFTGDHKDYLHSMVMAKNSQLHLLFYAFAENPNLFISKSYQSFFQ